MSDFCILRELLKPPPEAREGMRRVWVNESGRTPYWQFVEVLPPGPSELRPSLSRFSFTPLRGAGGPLEVDAPPVWDMEYEMYVPGWGFWQRIVPLIMVSPRISLQLRRRDRDFRNYTFVSMRNNLSYEPS